MDAFEEWWKEELGLYGYSGGWPAEDWCKAAFLAGCKHQREVDAGIAREYRVGFRGGWLEQICVDIANKIRKGGEGGVGMDKQQEQLGPYKSFTARLQDWIDGKEHGYLKSDVAKLLEKYYKIREDLNKLSDLETENTKLKFDLKEITGGLKDKILDLEAEVERLRRALEKIMVQTEGYTDRCYKIREIAEEALSGIDMKGGDAK